jgi:hypothetical protein
MDYELAILQYFKYLGYIGEKIPEGTEETPDFLIYDDSINFIVELKTKLPSDEEISHRQKTLASGNFYNIQEKIVRTNKLSRITRHAATQLKNYGGQDLFRIVFLLTTGHLAEPRFKQFEASLYGSTTIVDFPKGLALPCFFFYDSDFFRDRDTLDAAIVSTESDRLLLLNPHSPRASLFRECSLCERFDGGIIDPIELEKQGKAYYADTVIDRREEEKVLSFLRNKYHSETLTKVDMNFMSGTINFPSEIE